MTDDAEVLHCNVLKCRRVLSDAAVVTSCSHVFCLDCSNAHFHPEPSRRSCPACKTALPSPDEVYVQNLDVGFESRSVFLAGLPPALVLDLAAKAIHFFVYQQSQERAFQRLLLKKAQDRAANYSKQYESVVREATNEIQSVNDKVAALQTELDQHKARSRELKQQLKEAQAGYTKLKSQMDQMKQRKGPFSVHSAEKVAETLLAESRLDDQIFVKPSRHTSSSGPSQPFQQVPRSSASSAWPGPTVSHPVAHREADAKGFGHPAPQVATPRIPVRQSFVSRARRDNNTPDLRSTTNTPSFETTSPRKQGHQTGLGSFAGRMSPGASSFPRPPGPTFGGSL